MVRFWLRDDQFERIEVMLPASGAPRAHASDDRLFVSVLWIARNSSPA